MGKQLTKFGNGTERVENLLDDPRFPRPSVADQSTKYLKKFIECREAGEKTSEAELDQLYALFMETFETQIDDPREVTRYKEAFNESWFSFVRERVRENPARAMYMREQAVGSLSFYDAMRRIFDRRIPKATVFEAAFTTTHNIVGEYGALPLDDPSFKWDMWDTFWLAYRWRVWKIRQSLGELVEEARMMKGRPRVISLGCGLCGEVRHYGFTLEDLQKLDFIGIDREFHREELDKVFQHTFGVDFAGTGIKFLQEEILKVADDAVYHETAAYTFAMGIMSYAKDDNEACQLLDAALKMTIPGKPVDFDVQIVDDGLKTKATIFGWSEDYPLKPEMSADIALARWGKICAEVGAKIVSIEVEPRNDQPVDIFYRVTR